MSRRSQFTLLVVIFGLIGLVMLYSARAQETQSAADSGAVAPSIDGTYRLVSRDLPDGKTVQPPDVRGLLDMHNGHRNFNVCWKGKDGKPVSISLISQYAFDGKTYEENNLFYLMNGIAGKEPEYDLSDARANQLVTEEAGSYKFRLPLHGEPAVVFTADGFTATREGEFVDHWEKVK